MLPRSKARTASARPAKRARTRTRHDPIPSAHCAEFKHSYLTPKLGLGSGDTWSLAAILVRNLILNWLVLVPLS